MATIWKVLTRKKVINPSTDEETRLSRVLNTFDLTALGVGSTLGVGVYVLAGHVAKETAGPAVVLSFLIAAIASVFAGLCYAEFGARAPRAGSAYIYSYVCVGEFIAFVIGWNLILEYVIGSASVARGLSSYIDTLINDTLQNTFIEIAPIDIPYLAKYFDFFAFGISVLLAIALAFGLKESTRANNICTILNIFVVLFVVIAGSLKADVENWAVKPDHNSTNSTNSTIHIGNGGFFPFGIDGMIKGAATCFYGFVGFDCIATTGEEVRNPKRAIPISIILSLFIIFLAYFGTSTVVTLMVPYYLQDSDAPIPYAFEHVGWYTAKWIVAIGGIFGLCASLFGAMFPLPRIIYAMANDGLVFRFLGTVSSRFQAPVIGTLLAGLLTGLMAAVFELKQLVDMMSIGTLLAYTIVAASILLLRYGKEETRQYMPVQTSSDSDDGETYTESKTIFNSTTSSSINEDQELLNDQHNSSLIWQIFNCGRYENPTKISSMIVTFDIAIYCVMCIFIGLSAIYLKDPISRGEIWAIVLTSTVVLIAVILIISLVTQPTSNKELSFKVPMVPLIPALSILINIYLMLMLDSHTWIRFAVWMAAGLPIYYFSVRPYKEAQIKSVSNKNSFDHSISMVNHTQNGKFNGHTNIAFIGDDMIEKKSDESEKKGSQKKPAPLPPSKVADNTDIPPEITKLDEILEEASNSINSTINRKSSVGTLSNASDVVSREENVVAVVHRDNVITPANSNAPPSPTYPKKSFNDKESVANSLYNEINSSQSNTGSEVVSEYIQKEAPHKGHSRQASVDSPAPPESSSSSNSVAEDSIASEENKAEEYPIEETHQLDDTSLTIVPSEHRSVATPPSSPKSSSPNTEDETVDNVCLPVPPPLPEPSEEVNVVLRPTSANLNSVRLKPVKQRQDVEENETERSYEPDDDNLKVGSDKYKSFLESLTGKLQRLSVIPNYIPYMKKNVSPEEVNNKEKPKNENVIEERINQKEVIEKLNKIEGFLSRNLNVDNMYKEDKQQEDKEHKAPQLENDTESEQGSPSDSRIIENDYMNHKKRMQNVFRSINLKKSDSFKDTPEESQRNTKSLGASFMNEDKFKHRQAMSEIFKTIELRRKDSQKQDEL